ncbi:MAG: hypothetical protein CMJ83_12905 [Planctomycetes bacterium]|nr:hypothetical protein [Planctomycetota bacterium]
MNDDTIFGSKPPPSPDTLSGPQLVVIEGEARGTAVRVEKEIRIGRRPDNHLVLASPAVSKYHARVIGEDGRFCVIDLDSTNGIVVNGVSVEVNQPHALCHGDSVVVGDHTLLFRNEGTFTDKKTGMSTIHFDVSKVREEVDDLLKGMDISRDPESG